MGEIYFTSDTHFYHKNIITYCERPWRSVEEMNSALIKNWNKEVSKSDIVYHLGDIAFCSGDKLEAILNSLNGKIIHIPGNHDDKNTLNTCRKHHEVIDESSLTLSYDTYKIVISHKYMKHVKNDFLHFHGHEHGNDLMKSYHCGSRDEMRRRFKEEKWFGVKNNAIEVGVDLWDFKPVHIQTVLDKLI